MLVVPKLQSPQLRSLNQHISHPRASQVNLRKIVCQLDPALIYVLIFPKIQISLLTRVLEHRVSDGRFHTPQVPQNSRHWRALILVHQDWRPDEGLIKTVLWKID